jgi:hypothetical protein
MASQGGVSAAGTCTALYTALQHLASPEGDEQLYHVTARGLHLASRELQAAARRTLRHLRMDRYYNSLVAASGEPDDLFTALPWATLAACPAVTHWTLHGEQLQWFQPEVVDMVDAAAGRIHYLAIAPQGWYTATDTHLQGFGRLLWACSRLQEVRLTGTPRKHRPWLLLDPHSTSISTAAPPPLAICSMVLSDSSGDLLRHWGQQPRLANSLQRLHVKGTMGISDLAPLTNLRKLWFRPSNDLQDTPDPSVSSLSRMTKLTSLCLWHRHAAAAMEPLCALTGLQSLSLPTARNLVLSSKLAALKQLTSLDISRAGIDLPAALGVWLPRLASLNAGHCSVAAVPSSLTGLSWLSLERCSSSSLQLVLPTSLVRLQHLDIREVRYTSITGLSSMSALVWLDMSSLGHTAYYVLGGDLTVLRPLTRLRHLNLDRLPAFDAAWCTVLETLQHLTFLGLRWDHSKYPTIPSNGVPLSRPLPALQQLEVGGRGPDQWAALAPWVARLTCLTKLCLSHTELAAEDELMCLPPQLKELHVRGMPQLPRGLTRLTALQVLCAGGKMLLCQLPDWLSSLRQLEELDVTLTGVVDEQPVLAHMPGLRRVHLPMNADAAVVFGRASPVLPDAAIWDYLDE